MSAWLHFRGRVGTVDCLGENSRSGGLADSARSAEQIGMRQLSPDDGVFQGLGYVVLPDQRIESFRPVFSGRYYILCHKSQS